MPRDIDPRLATETTLYNLADLELIVSESMARRSCEIVHAEQIIQEEIIQFLATHNQGDS